MLSKILPLYYRKRLLFNAILSVAQVIVLGGTYFIIYTILLKNLGSQKLGTWSIVLSTSSIANIANIGLSSSLVKYIASYSNDLETNTYKINNLIKTSVLSIGAFVGIVCICLYFLGYYFLKSALPLTELEEAIILLPFSLASLWISSLGGVFLSTLDGFHSSSLRSLIYMISALIFVFLGWQLLPFYGLLGIAIAQITQSLTIVFLSIVGIKLVFKNLVILPLRWDKQTFNHIFKFSMNFQIIGLTQLLYDPITKFFLAKYGGLSFVGYYEMASRLIVQVRTLIVSANQVVVPSIATNSTNNIDESYPKILNLVILFTFPVIVGVIIFTPFISYYWIGHYEFYFITSLLILTISWFFNIISTPSYFSSIGLGSLQGILFSHIFIAIANISLGWLLGFSFGGIGVIVAWGVSLVSGSLITVIYYNRKFRANLKNINQKQFYNNLISSFLCICISYYLFERENSSTSPNILLLYSILIYFLYLMITISIYMNAQKILKNEISKIKT